MKLGVIGLGHVGLVTAERAHTNPIWVHHVRSGLGWKEFS
jgi:hypothetical protein